MFMKEWWTTDEFIRYLRYVAVDGGTPRQIIDIVEKPYHFETDFRRFQEWEDYHNEPTYRDNECEAD